MSKICSTQARRCLTGTVLFLASGLPSLAWKTKAVATNSPHSNISEFAMNLVKIKYPETSAEVDRFRGTLSSASGWLNNDANAHGNVLWNNERWSPNGSADPEGPEGKGYWAPINFNGGPFYRWWIRALQAESLCSSVFKFEPPATGTNPIPIRVPFEGSLDEWGRTNTGISAHRIYQYFGLMAHLIQDNNAPAHIANIRHGWWEGVEWWHDRGAADLGAGGRSYPDWNKVLDVIQTSSDGTVPAWSIGSFYSYFTKDINIVIKINDKDIQIPNIESYFSNIIDSNRDFAMPGLSAGSVQTWINNRKLTDPEQRGLKAYENERTNPVSWNPIINSFWFSSGLAAKDDLGKFINPVYDRPKGGPGVWGAGSGAGILAKGQWRAEHPELLSSDWHALNDGGTLWVPNTKYRGQAFDTNWGSHGGGLGFPNRDFPVNTELDLAQDAWLAGGAYPLGRIFPGDLYVVHPAQDYKISAQNIPGTDPQLRGFRDERSWDAVGINPMLVSEPAQDPPGAELLDRAGAWNAVFYKQVSEALPPMLTRFAAVPRRAPNAAQADFAKDPLPWFSGLLGAYLRIGFDTNRLEDHRVELYAIPEDQFAVTSNWKKDIELALPGTTVPPPGQLTESDLTVWDTFPILPDKPGSSSPTPGSNPLAGTRPPYDYGYQKLVGFPLVVAWGRQPLSQWNPQTTGVTSSSQFDVPVGKLTPNPEADRLPWRFQEIFTWDGEVEDPKPIILGSTVPSTSVYQPLPYLGKKVLPSGKYFLFIKVYKVGRHDAFARNQFKIQNTSKEVLEYFPWATKPWSDAWIQLGKTNLTHKLPRPVDAFIIPDELFPIRVDTRQPQATVVK